MGKENENTVEAEIVEDNQIILSEIKYPVSKIDLESLLKKYAEIPEINPNDENQDLVADQYQFVLKGHKALVRARTSIEKTRKALKEPALTYGKQVDDIAKEFQSMIKNTEDKLSFQRKLVEDNEDRKQREAEEIEEKRVDAIKSKILDIKNLPLNHFNSDSETLTKALESLRTITEAEYEEFTQEAAEVQALTISQLQGARDTKVKAEQADRLEAERLAKQAEIDAENERLAKEKQDKLDAEIAKFEQDKLDFQAKQDAVQEVADRKQAELEAEELLEREEEAKRQKAERNAELDLKCYNEAYDDIVNNKESALVDLIREGKIRHVKWEPTYE